VAPNTDSDRTFGTSHQPNLRSIDRCRVLDSCDNPVRHQENEVLPQRRSSSAIGSLRCDRRREVSCDPTMAARMSPMRNSRPAFENMKAWRSKESRLLAIRGRSDTGRFCDSTRACNDQQTPTFSAASSRAEWLGQRRPQLPHFRRTVRPRSEPRQASRPGRRRCVGRDRGEARIAVAGCYAAGVEKAGFKSSLRISAVVPAFRRAAPTGSPRAHELCIQVQRSAEDDRG
jgi:hypothetical protein